MSEEAAEQIGTEEAEEHREEAAQPSIEELARSMGYRSKEELKDPSKHVDPVTFIKNTAKFKDGYREEIKHLKRSLDGVAKTVSQVAAQKFNEGLKQAEAELKAAKETFDPEAIEAAVVKVQQAKAAVPAVATSPPEVDEWCERNPWFDTDKGMKADALEYREKFLRANPDATLTETLAHIERKIRKDYPEHFTAKEEKPTQRKAPAAGPEGVASVSGSSKEPWEKWEKELNQTERDTMNSLCAMQHNGKPVITKKQYIDNLAASGRFGR